MLRVLIEEWHIGDEGWVFEVGANGRLPCTEVNADYLAWLLRIWDEDTFRDVHQAVGDGTTSEMQVFVEGVVRSICALECRYPSSMGGTPSERSGTARQVRHARAQTGRVNLTRGVTLAFIIDIASNTQAA